MKCFDSTELNISAFVADSLKDILAGSFMGEVLMVNSAGIYLRAGERIILLCDAANGYLPMGVATDSFKSLNNLLRLSTGDRFSCRYNSFFFPRGVLRVAPRYSLEYNTRALKPKALRISEAAAELASLGRTSGISILVRPLIIGETDSSIVSVNPYCESAYSKLLRLLSALCSGDTDCVRSSVAELLGLGIGLTPSADDVMSGMLYVFKRMGDTAAPAIHSFEDELLRLCDSRTNSVSAAYFKAIASGDRYEAMEHVLLGLCGEERLDVSRLTRIGSSSGCEMLLGMLCALKVLG